MQQGVAENPSFQAYLNRGGVGASYEKQITKELADSYTKTPARPSEGDEDESDSEVDNPKSFTLTLLMHRWDRECKPRISACLAKRLENMNMSHADAFGHGLWLQNEDMGAKLMELRQG